MTETFGLVLNLTRISWDKGKSHPLIICFQQEEETWERITVATTSCVKMRVKIECRARWLLGNLTDVFYATATAVEQRSWGENADVPAKISTRRSARSFRALCRYQQTLSPISDPVY